MSKWKTLPKFDCCNEPTTLGPRWTLWLMAFELFTNGKGSILSGDVDAVTRQRRRALLLHQVGTDVQDIFSTLADTGEPTDYVRSVAALIKRILRATGEHSVHKTDILSTDTENW